MLRLVSTPSLLRRSASRDFLMRSPDCRQRLRRLRRRPLSIGSRPTAFDRRCADSLARGTGIGERATMRESSSVSSGAPGPLGRTSSRSTRAPAFATWLSTGITQTRAGKRLCEVAYGRSPLARLQRRRDRHHKPALRPLRAPGEDILAGYGSRQVAEGSKSQIADVASACTA